MKMRLKYTSNAFIPSACRSAREYRAFHILYSPPNISFQSQTFCCRGVIVINSEDLLKYHSFFSEPFPSHMHVARGFHWPDRPTNTHTMAMW
jgi:hypothetical protein